MKLFNFQENAIKEIERIYNSLMEGAILSSPTGSGKTIMMSTFIQRFLDSNPDSSVIWVTPNTGQLLNQSKQKFEELTGLETVNLSTSLKKGFLNNGEILFTNWEAIGKKSNISAESTEDRFSFKEVLNSSENMVLIIDEEHYNNTEVSRNLVNDFEWRFILRASATPNTEQEIKKIELVEIDPYDVISEGLIKKKILLNDSIEDGDEVSNKTFFLLGKGLEKRSRLKALYSKIGKDINPLMIIQIPNNNEQVLDEVFSFLKTKLIDVDGGKLSIYLSDNKENYDKNEIVKLNSNIDVIITKQAITMGWDVPRAQILVKLRGSKSESFKIQTLGRINRMPERMHYSEIGVNELNNSYVYSFDEGFNKGLLNVAINSGYSKEVKLKDGYEIELNAFSYEKDNNENYKMNINSIVLKEIKKTIGNTKDDFIKKGYKFNSITTFDVIESEISLTSKQPFQKTRKTLIQKDIDFNYLEISNSYRIVRAKLGGALGIFNRDLMGEILEEIFMNGKLSFKLSSRELYYFAINNASLLISLMQQISLTEDKTETNGEIIKFNYKTPQSKKVLADKKEDLYDFSKFSIKSSYENDLLNDPRDSRGEKLFKKWVDSSDFVFLWYKNEENGGYNTFSITYKKSASFARFEPDYILRDVENRKWVIEIKGENNIDIYSKQKFNALKEYAEQEAINFAFIRIFNDVLFFNNENWTEEYDEKYWKPIDFMLKNEK